MIVGILVVVVAILSYFGVNIMWILPAQASTQAQSIDWLWNIQMIAMSFLFALIVLMFFGTPAESRLSGPPAPLEEVWLVPADRPP